jgi:hypothetical protein
MTGPGPDLSGLTGWKVVNDYFMSECTKITTPPVLPNGITSIGNSFLAGCTSLTTVILNYPLLTNIGKHFIGVSGITGDKQYKLEKVDISNTKITTMEYGFLLTGNSTAISLTDKPNLKTVILPDTLTDFTGVTDIGTTQSVFLISSKTYLPDDHPLRIYVSDDKLSYFLGLPSTKISDLVKLRFLPKSQLPSEMFIKTTQSQYNELIEKDDAHVYWCVDTKKLYRGIRYLGKRNVTETTTVKDLYTGLKVEKIFTAWYSI